MDLCVHGMAVHRTQSENWNRKWKKKFLKGHHMKGWISHSRIFYSPGIWQRIQENLTIDGENQHCDVPSFQQHSCHSFPTLHAGLGKTSRRQRHLFFSDRSALSPAPSQGPQGASYPCLETHWLTHTCTWARWHLMASNTPKQISQWRCPSWESPTVPLFPPQPHSEGLAFLFLCLAFNLLKLTLTSLTPVQYKYSSTSCDGFDLDTQQGKRYQDLVVSLIAVFFLLHF